MAQPAPVSTVGSLFTSMFSCGARRACILCRDLKEIRRGCEPRMGDPGWQPVLQPASSVTFRLVVPLGLPRKQGDGGHLRWPRRAVGRTRDAGRQLSAREEFLGFPPRWPSVEGTGGHSGPHTCLKCLMKVLMTLVRICSGPSQPLIEAVTCRTGQWLPPIQVQVLPPSS